ncbi:hypothetical protein [Sediminibacterium ginsengisoli]|uniref:Uncharacterized protein n=1 Tax=Sediminibacterium ginsengisoli TaxID=413434 RepID=A0A1T4MN85_9BACT|nr:hypothetical protein [Sediminibacterium ginsengisoli]SJZ68265.1 hypothetical protein SAMN04488132_103464 [Sediminibacterium ginsengisoli]
MIILSFSLYAPVAARILAYTDCSIQRLANEDPRLCDCTRILTDDATNPLKGMPDKQKELLQKSDWKYLPTDKKATMAFHPAGSPKKYRSVFVFIPAAPERSVFHPPAIIDLFS